MAVGLTLIYSVQGVVSFAHGQLYMVGGYFSFYFLQHASYHISELIGTDISVNPIWGIPVAAIIVFIMGAIFERVFLKPMHEGLIERVSEYAILITFGFGFFLEYTTLAIAGPFPQKTDRFIQIRRFTLDRHYFNDEFYFGPIHIIGDRAFAMVVGIVLIFALLYFLQRSWTGRALRATSQDRQAAAVTGINPTNMNTLSFAMGSMLAAMSGAALIPIFNWGALGRRRDGRPLLRHRGARWIGFGARRARRRHYRRHRRGARCWLPPRSQPRRRLQRSLRPGNLRPRLGC